MSSDFMIHCVTFPALMEWFKKKRERDRKKDKREQSTRLSMKRFDKRLNSHGRHCGCVQHSARTHKNKYKYLVLPLPDVQDYDFFFFDVHTYSQYRKSNKGDCNIYIDIDICSSTDMLNFLTKQAHPIYL